MKRAREKKVNFLVSLQILDGVIIVVLSLFIEDEWNYYNGNESEPHSSSFLEPKTISPSKFILIFATEQLLGQLSFSVILFTV